MSPSQVITDKQATHRGEKSERVIHPKESERHKPKLSASMMSDKKNLVLFATKSEMREVCENPSSVMHFVFVCKDGETKTNTIHELPLGLPPLRGIEHRIDFIPGAPLPNKAPYRVNPEKLRRSNGKYNNSSTTVRYMKA